MRNWKGYYKFKSINKTNKNWKSNGICTTIYGSKIIKYNINLSNCVKLSWHNNYVNKLNNKIFLKINTKKKI